MATLISGGGHLIVTSGLKFMPIRLNGRALLQNVCWRRRNNFLSNVRLLRGSRSILPQEPEDTRSLVDQLELESQRMQQQLQGSHTLQRQRSLGQQQPQHRTVLEKEREVVQKLGRQPTLDHGKSNIEDPLGSGSYELGLLQEETFMRDRSFKDVIRSIKDGISYTKVTSENQHDIIRKVMTPLHSLTYAEQLRLKQQKNEELVFRLLKESKQHFCQATPAIPSPVLSHYRNKDEFSVHVGIDGDPKTVGFFVGSPIGGRLVCVEPEVIEIIKPEHKLVARHYQIYIRHSPLPADILDDGSTGHWKSIFVRSNSAGEIMATVMFNPQQLAREALEAEKTKLAEYFSVGPGKEANVTSLYFAVGRTLVDSQLLYGPSTFIERFADHTFEIGPETFFPSNLTCMESLVDVVKRHSKPRKNRKLLDLSCGGLYSILFSSESKQCIGFESMAKETAGNAARNQVVNFDSRQGQLDLILPVVLEDLEADGELATVILDPGRAGVNPRVAKALRNCENITRLVFVSSQPEGMTMCNLVDLCKRLNKIEKKRSKNSSKPFSLVCAVPIDMYPHTHCCEHVFVLRR